MNFRIANLQDLPVLNKIRVQSKSHWGYPSSWIEKWMDDLTISEENLAKENILLIEIQDQIIGFCSFVENEAEYEIYHLWVLPDFIGKGYGRKLLNKAIENFATSNKPIIVEADPNAEAFYCKQGFETFDQIESFPKGRFLPVMKKTNLASTSL